MTIRQLSQVTIKEELVRNGVESRYSLNGEEFGVVNPALSDLDGLEGADLVSTDYFRRAYHRCFARGRNQSEDPCRRRNRLDDNDVCDQGRGGRRAAWVEVIVPRSLEICEFDSVTEQVPTHEYLVCPVGLGVR